MVLQKQNGSYYRVRVLKEETYRVKIGNALALWLVSICSSQSASSSECACIKQHTLCTANSAPICTKQCPFPALNSACDVNHTAVQCVCLHTLPLPCAECTKFVLAPSISWKGSKAGWSVWAISVLTSVVCVQSSWGLSSSCSPAGWLETQSASGGAATRTKPGSIWSDIALHFTCSHYAAFQVTAVVSTPMATAALFSVKFAMSLCRIPSDCSSFNMHDNSCGCLCKVCNAFSSN